MMKLVAVEAKRAQPARMVFGPGAYYTHSLPGVIGGR